jgi:hypothetical protein
METPSPPISNILLPTKRFENYKEVLIINIERLLNNIILKGLLQKTYQQQRLLKRLYKYPLKNF